MARTLSDERHPNGRVVRTRGPVIRGIIIGYCIFALAVVGLFWYAHHNQVIADHKFNEVALDRDRLLAAQAKSNCRDIEKLKKARRGDVIKSFREIKVNAKLLGIPLTPELLDKARADKFATLRRYAPEVCPRKIIP